MIKSVGTVILALLALACLAPGARASVVVPLDASDLIAQAGAIVIGRVADIESHWDDGRAQIYSTITVAVEEILKGGPAVPTVTLRQDGGAVGGVFAWTEGSPEFTVGERALLFLGANADGSLRVLQLAQGKLTIEADEITGEELAFQDPTPPGVHVLSSLGGPPTTLPVARRLADLRQEILAGGGLAPARPARLDAPALMSAPTATESSSSFSFFNPPGRWFEPDSSLPVVYRVNSLGQSGAPTRGFDQFRAALAAWSSVTDSSLRLQDGGFTDATTMMADGVNAVMFGDKEGRMDPPVNCRGFLAVGGYFRYNTTKTVNGTTFYRIIDGDVSVADGWAGCNFYESFANFAEVLTHEIGHTVGFGHSADPDATMSPTAHFDGRGASLRADDIAAALYSYPASAAPEQVTLTVTVSGAGSITTIPAGISCPGQCSMKVNKGAYVNLYPSGDRLAAWGGACSGTAEFCQIVMSGNKTVTAAFGAPDLVVAALANPPAALAPGGRFTVTDTTSNIGPVNATSSRTRYYLSLNTTRDGGDILLSGTRSLSTLVAGAAHTGSLTVTVPSTVALATYSLLACADDLSAVVEGNETNNCRAAAGRIQITRPDLLVDVVTPLASTVTAGARLSVSDTTRNQGLVAAVASATRYYLSSDRTRTSADKLMSGSRSVPGLAVQQSSTGTTLVSIPSGTVPGPYYVIACADDTARIPEVDHDNNCRASAATFTVSP